MYNGFGAVDNPSLVKALLEHSADPMPGMQTENPFLDHACFYNHIETVKVLLEHHISPNVKDENGELPYGWLNMTAHAYSSSLGPMSVRRVRLHYLFRRHKNLSTPFRSQSRYKRTG